MDNDTNDVTQNWYYDTRTKKVYSFQQYRVLDSNTKEFIKMVPFNGKIVNGLYVEKELGDDKDMSALDRDIMTTIKMVNEHSEKAKAQRAEEQIERNRIIQEDNMDERIKFAQAEIENISDDISSRTNEDSDKTFLLVDVLKKLKEKTPKGNYDYMSEKEIQDAFNRSRLGAKRKKETNKLKVKVAVITVAVTLMLGAVAYVIEKGAELIARNDKLGYANTSISQLAYDKEHDMDHLLSVAKNPAYSASIVWQNCHWFINDKGERLFFFYNDRIAADILREPSYAVDMAIYQVYKDMGIYRDNGSYHNLDDVFKYLHSYTSNETHPLHEKFIGKTFTDYLTSSGYYDVETWIEDMENQMIKNADRLHQSASERLNELGFGR